MRNGGDWSELVEFVCSSEFVLAGMRLRDFVWACLFIWASGRDDCHGRFAPVGLGLFGLQDG